jgi:hypothetical protein
MLAVVHLLGCADQGPAPVPDTPDPSDPTFPTETSPAPWTFEDDEPAPGPVAPAALERALQVALVQILTYDARAIVDPYLARYAESATPACPGAIPDGYGNEYWATGCNADDGTYFGGYITQSVFTDVYSDDGGIYQSGATLGGNIVLVEPDGATLDLEGTAAVVTGASLDGNVLLLTSALLGGFAYDSADADGWLADGMQSLDVTLFVYDVVDVGGRLAVVDGAVNPFIDGETWSVQFANTAANAPIGSACDLEPGGIVQIRDPAGRWVSLAFDGPILDLYTGEFAPGDPQRCDGCADASVDGEPIGAVCADFTPWLDWEMAP